MLQITFWNLQQLSLFYLHMAKDKKITKSSLKIALLKGVSMQRIENGQLHELEELLNNSDNEDAIKNFFQNLAKYTRLDIEILEQYLKKQFTSDYNLPTTLSELCSMKEQNNGALKIIKGFSSISQINGHIITIDFPDYFNSFKGQIQQASNKIDNQIFFHMVDQKNNNQKVTLILKSQKNQQNQQSQYISKVKIEGERNIPFGEWIQTLKYKKNDTRIVQQKKSIKVNDKGAYSLKNILPEGIYTILLDLKDNKPSKITFVSPLSKRIEFVFGTDKRGQIIVSCNELERSIYFGAFKKSLSTVQSQEIVVKYTPEQYNQFIKIMKPDENHEKLNIVKLVNQINDLKTEVMGILKQDYLYTIFVDLLNLLITSPRFQRQKRLEDILYSKDFCEIRGRLEIIQNNHRQEQKNLSLQQILHSILIETNYSQLINKKGAVNTVRILQLLVNAEESLKLIKGKTIIAFFGTTGSGKSTSVNFFMGIHLKFSNDKYGGKIVQKDEDKYKKLECAAQAKIGHKIGTSETLYAQGHKLIESEMSEDLKETLKDVVLCDSPGFDDTRGTQYEICTGMSIDMAMEKSKSIQAIVLVIPYASFTNDRSKNVFSLLGTMMERFPDLLKVQTATHKSFHILITKWDNNDQVNSFRKRLNDYINEQVQSNRKNNGQYCHAREVFGQKIEDKLSLLKILLKMFDDNRIKFIHLDNNIRKKEQLQLYLKSKQPIPKNRYQKLMQFGDLKQKFTKQLLTSAHTWTTLIFHPFTKVIPDQIKECIARIKQLEDDHSKRCKEISALKKQITDSQNKIKQYENQLSLCQYSSPIMNDTFTSQNELFPKDNVVDASKKITLDLQKKIKVLQQKILSKQKEIQTKQEVLVKQKEKLKERKQSNDLLIEKIKKLKQGKTKDEIYQFSHHLGQTILINIDRPKDEVQKAWNSTQIFPRCYETQQWIVGSSSRKHFVQPVIQRKYSIAPNKVFDPEEYIDAFNKSQSYQSEKFIADIESKHSKLVKIKASDGGKKIMFKVCFYYEKCQRQQDLPYFRIVHWIDNEVMNATEILNKQSELKTGEKEVEKLEESIASTEQLLNSWRSEKKVFEQSLASAKKDLSANQEDVKLKVQEFYSIQRQKQNIQSNKKKIAQFQKLNKQIQEKIKEEEINYQTLKFLYRRIAFLIKDQIQKQIPQSLLRFIEQVLKNEDNKQSKSDIVLAQEKYQREVFTKFVQIFKENRTRIQAQIESVLSDQQFRITSKALPQINVNNNIHDKVYVDIADIQINFKPDEPVKKGPSGFDDIWSEFPKPDPQDSPSCFSRCCSLI